MARKQTPTPDVPKITLTAPQLEWGISLLGERIDDLRSFDIQQVSEFTPGLKALSASINGALERCFGADTSAFKRYRLAATLQHVSMSWASTGERRFTDYKTPTKANIARAVELLKAAQCELQEELSFLQVGKSHEVKSLQCDASPREVFVVHGHDEAALQGLARFLEKLGLKAIILREQPDQGLTIIEKFEQSADRVGFAVVLLTPDDIGGTVSGSSTSTRARQNVVFELGYFSGKLGRGKVCLLKKGNIELPSDLYGVIYTAMDENGGWQTKLVKEMKAARLEFDANKLWD